jgi:hypothetical protein
MNTASHNPPLVAPRPVRLTSGSPHSFLVRSQPIRLVSAPAEQQERDSNDDAWPESSGSSDKERASPGASPRSSLPSEALEEFLSILRPSFLPSSPNRPRRSGSVPTFPYAYKASRRIELVHHKSEYSGLYDVEELERSRSTQLSRNASSGTPESASEKDADGIDDLKPREIDGLPLRWFASGNLSSPVSRMHTRNPFQRHPSYEIALSGFIPSNPASPSIHSPGPSAMPVPMSPATIPLPPPSPGEVIEVA